MGVIVAALIGIYAFWHLLVPVRSVPLRTLRIGFEENPPVQIRTPEGFSGLSVETVSEAARRAGIGLQWSETHKSSEESLRKGLVDLWPLMVNLPERRKFIHFPQPWIQSKYIFVLPSGSQITSRTFRGRIGLFRLPLHKRLLQERLPEAEIVEFPAMHDVIQQVCEGRVAAAFFEMRVGMSEFRERPSDCASTPLRIQTVPDMELHAGVASTLEAAGAADRIQREIGRMYADGTLAALIAKYGYFGIDDTWASYERLQAEQRWKYLALISAVLLLATGVTLSQASSLRQRKRSEAALRESEQRFRTLADTAPVKIVASAADGRATFFNKTWLDFTGRTMEQELDYGWTENLHPDDRERFTAEYSRSLASRGECRIEYRLRRVDGEYRNILCTGVPRLEADGAFAGYIASCLDLTDIKIAQKEASARQNLESIGVLAGGIAHDFNNLLGGALAYAELAQVKLEEGITPQEELLHIRDVAIRGSEIVRQLMIFAGKEQGTLDFVDLSSVVREMLDLVKVSISKRAVLKMALDEKLPVVHANPAELRQLVMNLVTNASEALNDRDGFIQVSVESCTIGPDVKSTETKSLVPGSYVHLEVSDNGCGMAPEVQRRAFDPFYTTKFIGRGIGLSVVQGIVRRLEGEIQVVSTLGEGTTISVLLPSAANAPPARTPVNAGRPLLSNVKVNQGTTILVVEDEEALLQVVTEMLARRGFSVLRAKDGSAALHLIRELEFRIDGMLLDVTLPGAPSEEILREANRMRPELMTVLTSAYSREGVASSFAGLKIDEFIRKPFHLDKVVTLFEKRLGYRSSTSPSV